MQYYNPSCYLSTELDGIITLWRTGGRGITSAEKICFPNHPNVAVPVPFFGNIGNNKPLIFTIGSNPSDREFIDKSGSALTVPRFFNPSTVHPSYSVATIWGACNEYFLNKPYKGWFGEKDGSKIEGFLNLLGASYYDSKEYKYQAVHLDLMPFPTEEKFVNFKKNHPKETDYYIKSYGLPLIDSLIFEYRPKLVICVSEDACTRLLGSPVGTATTSGKTFKYYKGTICNVKAFGTSVYYPNPYGSTPSDWKKDILPLV